jgi:putative hemolysin
MKLISPSSLNKTGLSFPDNPLLKGFLYNYTKIHRINSLYEDQRSHASEGIPFIQGLFEKLCIQYDIADGDLLRIPSSGPYIVLANHPFGFLDGMIMIDLFGRHNKNLKVLANFFLGTIEPIKKHIIDLNPFSTNSMMNYKGMRSAYSHIQRGYPIGVFPAGEVASFQKGFGKVEDRTWDKGIVKFMVNANIPIVPLYFHGGNSLLFHFLGKIHPTLRTLSLPKEFFRKEKKNIRVRIGKVILPSDLKGFESYDKAGKYLRTCLYALDNQAKEKKFLKTPLNISRRVENIINPVPVEDIVRELESLRRNKGLLSHKSNFEVFLAGAKKIPNTLREIGRLREETFRQVGEGTNKAVDIDHFDCYYKHLFLWDKDRNRIVGAYRFGKGDKIIRNYSKKGFYVSTLFDLDDEFTPILKQTLELGRSFVVKDYQQKPLPLFLLWQGILQFLSTHKKYKYLIGPVSISSDFSRFSKDLLIAFIKKHYFNADLAKWVYPYKKFNEKTNRNDIDLILEQNNNDLQKLDRFIAGIEPGYMKIPVLLKQYIKQNAKIIGFNVDPKFNYCLDGLMILDLDDLPESTYSFLNSRK